MRVSWKATCIMLPVFNPKPLPESCKGRWPIFYGTVHASPTAWQAMEEINHLLQPPDGIDKILLQCVCHETKL